MILNASIYFLLQQQNNKAVGKQKHVNDLISHILTPEGDGTTRELSFLTSCRSDPKVDQIVPDRFSALRR